MYGNSGCVGKGMCAEGVREEVRYEREQLV